MQASKLFGVGVAVHVQLSDLQFGAHDDTLVAAVEKEVDTLRPDLVIISGDFTQRARTEQVNRDSAARLAKQNADRAVADAEASQQTAVASLTDAQQTFKAQQAEIDKLADLESREVLLAKLAGAMKGNLAKAAGLFNAPASQIARLAQALQDKRAAEGSGSTEEAVAAVESADAAAAES